MQLSGFNSSVWMATWLHACCMRCKPWVCWCGNAVASAVVLVLSTPPAPLQVIAPKAWVATPAGLWPELSIAVTRPC